MKLTERQREVVAMIAEGEKHETIAYRLGISHKTVEFHRSAARKVLKCRNTADLIRYAILNGIANAQQSPHHERERF